MDKMKNSDVQFNESYEVHLVYKILSKNKENKSVAIERQPKMADFFNRPDLYAPNGIPSLKIEGKTLIEVKNTLSYASLQNIRVAFNLHKDTYNFVVVYFKSRLSPVPKDINDTEHICKFLSYEEIIKGKKVEKGQAAKDFYYLGLSKTKDWKCNRDDLIDEAKSIVEQGNCVLFLGAGVSMSAKMPSWNELLKGLMAEVKQLKGETLDAFKELSSHVLYECGDSYLVMARYLQTAIRLHDKDMEFSELIQKYLYSKEHTSQLLSDLARIVQQRKADEVITYNFDDILEQELVAGGLQDGKDFIAISRDAEISDHEKVPIYHVHGIIPEKGPADVVVFSEEEYHKRYSNSFHWSNIEQLHALSRKHCFFVGLSMTDPNLRRLLDAARSINRTDTENHYAFLKRQKMEKYCLSSMADVCKYVHISESLIDKNKQKDIYILNYTVLESIFRELGVKVIWYEEFDELPVLIERVFGLNARSSSDTASLIMEAENKIEEIKDIEKGLKDFNAIEQINENVTKYLQYIRENAAKYKCLISEVNEILADLSLRGESDKEMILKMQHNRPTFNNNMSGYAEYYSVWLNFLKKILPM